MGLWFADIALQGQSLYLVGPHFEDLITHIPMTTCRLQGKVESLKGLFPY
jgi:hypothetical protein